MNESGKKGLVLAAFFIVITITVGFIFFKFIYAKVCNDKECFTQGLSKCERVTFFDNTPDAVWYYKVRGRHLNGDCIIDVTLKQIKQGDETIKPLEGKEMTCYLPYKVVEYPQKDMDRCHGLLKEEIQSVLIDKMHSYLLENVGQVSKELQGIF